MLASSAAYVQRVELGMFEPLDEYLDKDDLVFDDEYVVNTQVKEKFMVCQGNQ